MRIFENNSDVVLLHDLGAAVEFGGKVINPQRARYEVILKENRSVSQANRKTQTNLRPLQICLGFGRDVID